MKEEEVSNAQAVQLRCVRLCNSACVNKGGEVSSYMLILHLYGAFCLSFYVYSLLHLNCVQQGTKSLRAKCLCMSVGAAVVLVP